MTYHWDIWIIVWENKLYLNLMCFEIPRKQDILSLQILAILHLSDFLIHAVRTMTPWLWYYYSLGKRLTSGLGFFWDINQDMEWTKYPWGQYYMVQLFTIYIAQYMSKLGVFCLYLWMELWKIHHQTPHIIEVRHDQCLGLKPEVLILYEMVREKYISLNMSGVTNWVVQLYFISILHPRH